MSQNNEFEICAAGLQQEQEVVEGVPSCWEAGTNLCNQYNLTKKNQIWWDVKFEVVWIE